METIEISIDGLNRLVNAICSCGGRGPDDNPCDACKLYHMIIESSESQKEDR